MNADAPSAKIFDQFYEATNLRVVRAIYALTGDVEEARDCTQEAYEKAWINWPKIESHADPEAWVRSAAKRLAVSRWRHARLAARKTHLLAAAGFMPAPSDDYVALMAGFHEISSGQREALILYYLCGRTLNEVAKECRIPLSTAKARLRRGRIAMAQLLSDAPPDVADTSGRPSHVR